jgi:hypothetical protein
LGTHITGVLWVAIGINRGLSRTNQLSVSTFNKLSLIVTKGK